MTTNSPATFAKAPSNPRKSARILGALLALSSPLSGILPFAVVASIVGEERLENADGITGLGLATIAIPAFVGLAIVAWSFTKGALPPRRVWQFTGLALASVFAVSAAVAYATVREGDAAIGAGLLIMTAVVTFAAVAVEAVAHKKR